MARSWRRVMLLACAALTLDQPAAAQCLPLLCGYSESGKGGPYLQDKVKTEKLAKSDALIEKARVDGSLGAGSIDQGKLFGSGLSMPKTELALERFVDSFRAHWPHRQPGPIDVKIVGSYTFSPLAHADNVIVVPLGMLIKAENDDQIAWLLAHEFSHLALGHFARHTSSRKREKMLGDAVSVLQGGVIMATSEYRYANGRISSQLSDRKQAEANMVSIYFRSEQLRSLLSLVNNFFSRSQEDQADVLGLDLVYAAGFADIGASTSIAELGREDAARKSLFAEIGSDLTKYAEVEAKRALVAAGGTSADLKQQGNKFADSMLGNLTAIGVKRLTEYYGATHRPTDARREGISRYFERAYPNYEVREPKTTWLTALRNNAEYRDAKLMLDAVTAAREALAAQNGVKAIAALGPALKSRYGQSAFLLNTAAQAYVTAQRPAEAEKLYTAASKVQNTADNAYLAQSLEGFIEHVDLLIAMRNQRRANEIITLAAGRFGDDNAFLPQRVRMAMANGNADAIYAAMALCTKTQDVGLIGRCEAEIGGPEVEAAYAGMTPIEQAQIDKARVLARQGSQSKGFWDSVGKMLGGKDDDAD